MRIWKRLIVVLLVVALVAPVLAQGDGEQIPNFKTRIEVKKNNSATITETIVYDFDFNFRHGILRYIPLRTQAENTGKFYIYDFEFLFATQDGQPAEVNLSRDRHWQNIRLGDPDKTITGQHIYTISYRISQVVERDPEGDLFNWNLTGNEWQVPILAASAAVEFEPGMDVKESRCYSGPTGSAVQECKVSAQENRVTVNANRLLQPGEGLTLQALVASGSFTSYLEPQEPPATDWLPVVGIVLGVLALLGGLVIRLASWLKHKYELSQQTVVPQYESPGGMSPGEVGLLNDNRTGMQEITATLIDLAVRGYIKIEQTQSKGLFKKPKYKFHLLKALKGVADYERELLDMIFTGAGKKAVKLDDISAAKASASIRKVEKQLKQRLEKQGYYAKPAKCSRRRKWAIALTITATVAVAAINIYSLTQGSSQELVIASFIVLAIGLVAGWVFTRRTKLSLAGYEQWAEVEGLKLYLTISEKERLKFHDAPAKNPKHFNELLAFAVALGVEKEWAKQFKGMEVTKDSNWYVSNRPFTAGLLASSLSSDFSKSVSSNFTPTQSSGGYSGGGFSGGGGGGGGGGSW